MRRIFLIVSLALCGAGLAGLNANAQSSATSRAPAASAQQQGGGTAAGRPAGAENCGTPDEFRACPPMPRVPFQTFPGAR